MLTREMLVGPRQVKTGAVDVPELGGEVLVRPMPGRTFYLFVSEASAGDDGMANVPFPVMVSILLDCVCDAEGKPILKPDDRAAVEDWDFQAVTKIFLKVLEVSNLTGEAVEQAEGN